MNWVMAGRKIRESSAAGIARAAVANTGVAATVWVLTACAVEQIEQVW